MKNEWNTKDMQKIKIFFKSLLTKNGGILLTCIITILLVLASHIISCLINMPAGEKTLYNILSHLSDKDLYDSLLNNLSITVLIWCILGFIDELSTERHKLHKIPPVVAMIAFLLYFIWYIIYSAIDKNLTSTISEAVILIIFFIMLLIFFADDTEAISDDGLVG